MRAMPNIATTLKDEISRIARKQVRSATASLKSATTTHRSEIAELKRRLLVLERQLAGLRKTMAKTAPLPSSEPGQDAAAGRFSAKGFASHRSRLALSAIDCGQLLSVSGQTVYNWEAGKSRPRAAQMPAIMSFRTLGKREAAARLSELAPTGDT